eukprot:gene25956-33932_t
MSEEAANIDNENKTGAFPRFRSVPSGLLTSPVAEPLGSKPGMGYTESPGFNGPKIASMSISQQYRPLQQAFEKFEIAPPTPGSAKAAFRGVNSPSLLLPRPSPVDLIDPYMKAPPVDPNLPYSFPGRPQILSRTHFEISKSSFDNIPTTFIERMNTIELPKFDSFDFSDFDRDDGVWHGKYIRGATCCDVDVFVYSDRKSDKCIVEVNKTKGDSKPYVQFFKDLKAVFVPQTEAPKQSTPLFNFGSLSCSMISDEDYLKGLQP